MSAGEILFFIVAGGLAIGAFAIACVIFSCFVKAVDDVIIDLIAQGTRRALDEKSANEGK
jgi:hypothetical protein